MVYAGLTAGAIGLAQFNIRLPDTLEAASPAELVIQFGAASSMPVALAIGRN